MPSQAFRQAIVRIREISILQRSSRLSTVGVPVNFRLENSVNRGAIVLLCSHLEGYIEDVITEAVDKLNASSVSVSQLPPILRLMQCNKDLDDLGNTNELQKRFAKTEALFLQHGSFWTPGQKLSKGTLVAERITGEMSNPGSKHIRSLFRIFGIPDVIQDVIHLPSSMNKAVIDELVFKRNSIAHGELSATATRTDVRRYILHSFWLCQGLDKVFGTHLASIIGSSPW